LDCQTDERILVRYLAVCSSDSFTHVLLYAPFPMASFLLTSCWWVLVKVFFASLTDAKLLKEKPLL